MNRKVKFNIIIGAILGTLIGVLACTMKSPIDPIVTEDKSEAYYSTFNIISGSISSSGVLLETGFIVGCGHGVDTNKDWKLQNTERNVKLKFQIGRDSFIIKGRVIFMEKDYCIIEPEISIKSKIKFVRKYLRVGEPVYTFGFPASGKLHLSDGLQSGPTSLELERTTLGCYYGNSGGGVFDKDGNTVGILTSMNVQYRQAQGHSLIILPTEEGRIVVKSRVNATYDQIVQNWSEYMSSWFVYEKASRKNMGWMLITPQSVPSPYLRDIGGMGMQLFIIFAMIGLFRKELFSS